MNDEQLIALLERFVVAFEVIADAVKGTHDEAKRVTNRLWPERSEHRDARISRVPTAADKAREDQGATDTRPIQQWAGDLDDDPESGLGVRERQWLKDHQPKKIQPTDTKAGGQAG